MAAPEDRLLSTEEVAERLQVDEQTVRRWIKSGKLEAFKPGREWRITPAAVEKLLESYSSPKAHGLALQLELEEQRGADKDIVQRYSKVPGAIDDLIGQQAKARERELDDPNSPWFANLHIASLWLEMVSEEAGRLRAWVEKYAPILQPPSTTLSDRREFLVHNLQLVSHASMTYHQLYRKAKKHIETMNESPDDLARRRVEKADADMQENERRLHELQEAASS